MPISQSISLAQKYSPILDGIYKKYSCTALLDTPADLVQWVGGNTAKIFKTEMQGNGDYSRSTGFVTGNINAGWETYALAYDRGRSLTVDAMDNEETLGMAFGTVAGEYMRTCAIPELDAYRFAKICGTSNISSANADITVGTTDCVSLLDTAEETMGDNEVPEEGRILFVSEKFYHGLKAKITRTVQNDVTGINRVIEMYDGMQVVKVPKGRFNTAIELLDGSSQGETDGGWKNVPSTGSSYAINFLIVHPTAVTQIVKHQIPRIWTPEQNINADAFKFDFRTYGDCFVKDNKVKGIYLHRASTANA